MDFCMTICTRGAEYKHMFYETLRHLEALAVWAERSHGRFIGFRRGKAP
jgi:hypothetical protein